MIERRVWVLDCETTGVNKDTDKVVEVAGVLLEGPRIVKTYTTLVNPGIPIPPVASAVHHLRDHDVEDAPSIDAALQPLLEEEHDYVVAHNAGFDSGFIDLGSVGWLCTWKLSMLLWPDAPGHSNQVLRYWLDTPDPSPGSYPHRALYDAEVTAGIFAKILERSTQEDPYPGMWKVSSGPIRLIKCNFGEHTGKLWSDVPVSYMNWILKSHEKQQSNPSADAKKWDENVIHTVKYWKERL